MAKKYETDPRYYMAEVYKIYRRKGKDANGFTKEINNCEGPDHAIEICKKYIAFAKFEEVK